MSFKILRKNNYLPSMMCLGRIFSIVNQFSIFLQHILGQFRAEFCREDSLHTVKLFEDICEIALSDARNHTFNSLCRLEDKLLSLCPQL